MIRGVILDYGSTLIAFDGVLADVRTVAHRALVEALRREGLAVVEPSFQKRFSRLFEAYDRRRAIDNIETTAIAVLTAAVREEKLPPQPVDRLRRALRAMYEVYESHWRLFPDALGALEKIRASGLPMAMLSNASDVDNVRRMLAAHGLEGFFDPVVISAAIGIRKPDPRAFRPVLDAWGIPAPELVMVGDTLEADIFGAKQLGMRAIWIGAEEPPLLRRLFGRKVLPDAQVKTIGEAAALLLHWKDRESA